MRPAAVQDIEAGQQESKVPLLGSPLRLAGLVSRECKAVNSLGCRLLADMKKFQSVGTSMGVSRGDKRSIKGHRGISQMGHSSREDTMRIKLTYLAPLFGTAAAAVAILAAPIAAADIGQTCSANGSGTICQSPGNAQINDAPPPVNFYPYGGEAFLL
jgi:hypothetical protein